MASGAAPARADTDELPEPNRDRILVAALEEFANRGFDGTSTAAIARRAGVTQPLVHYHFDSKDALWRAAVAHAAAEFVGAFAGVEADLEGLGTGEQIEVLLRRFVRFSAARPELGRIISHEGVQGGPRLEWMLGHAPELGGGALRHLIRTGMAAGELKPLPDELVAVTLSAAAAYLFVVKETMRIVYGIDVTDPDVVEAHADTLVELVLRGLLADDARGGGEAGRG